MSLTKELNQIATFEEILARVSYPGFYFIVSVTKEAFYFHIECNDRCNVTGEHVHWKSRKWLLSEHMTDGEIVQTAFKAVMTAIEHETREKFMYRGQAIFDPHYDIEALVALRQDTQSTKERTPLNRESK